MSKLTDIKQKILQLDGGAFQELCDAYLFKLGYENVLSLGARSGTMKTTKGIPDTYFLDPSDNYIFVMYTTQQSNIYEKIKEDIYDCLNPEKTGIPIQDISEVIYCHTSSNLSAGKDKELRDVCSASGILLRLYGIDEIASNIYTRFHGISRDFLGVSISTEQIFGVNEFVAAYDSNGMAAPLSTVFQFREKEVNEVLTNIESAKVTVITGPAGVGKTRLALECCQKYALENNYRFFCIQSNRLPIYEDLKVYLDTPNKYLLLIDDANQISGLQHILQYLTKYVQGYDVKIVITVRDYAKLTTIQDIRNFTIPEIYTISTFSDDEIKKLLETNLQILNPIYLDKIVRIAEGNARLAIIAGKLAIETQSLSSINDATQLYEGYYEKFIQNNIFDQNRDLCAVAGIIAFLTAINLEHLDNLTPLLDQLNISNSLFVKYAHQLHDLELVDIYNNKAVKISDQCLGNYLLSYVFMKKRIIPLSVMLKVCFGSHKPRVINAVNTLANIFASKDMHQQLEMEISIVWDEFENSQSPLFFDFVKVFYSIRPTETLLMLKERIDSLPQGSLDISSIDFEKESRSHIVNDDVLGILGGFNDSSDLPLALDLLFMYYKKTPQNFMGFYHTIINSFGVRKESHRYDYWTQTQLISKFIEHADEWKNKELSILFIKVSAEFLKLQFSPTEAGRGHTIIMYQIPVQLSNGSKKYRELIWNSLFELYNYESNQSEIEQIIKEYGQFSRDGVEKELVQFDSQLIIRFFSQLFSPNKLSHCIIAKEVMDQLKRIDLDVKPYLSDYLNSSDYLFYKILKGERYLEEFDWEKEQELKKNDIQVLLSDCTEERILKIIQICSIYEDYDRNNVWDISGGLHFAFIQLASYKNLFLYAVNMYLAHNTPINLYPDTIVNKLFELVGTEQTYGIINNYEFDQKNAWQFSFFKNLPFESISEKTVQQLYDFLSENEGKITSSPYREIEFLDKYRRFDDDVFVKAGQIILSKHEYSPFMFSLYLHSTFSPYGHGTNPDILMDRFKNDFSLLKDIYLKLISYDKHTDSDGRYLIYFMQKEISFIDEFIEFTQKDKDALWNDEGKRLSAIWNCDNYIQHADYIFKACNENLDNWQIEKYVEQLFKTRKESKSTIARQDEWISQFIEANFNNAKFMNIIFSSISEVEFSPERRKKHILHFVKLNTDPLLFDEIQLEPRGYGGVGSMIPYMEARISFLESLLPALNGLTYLKHKQRIERSIEAWRRSIEREQIGEILQDL
ncbi:ATP-binding protein [Paenibacillus timonensis]|nr:ATP-binding protein [Paenibacillus timonensis]MUG87279.1 ATP-binding protein [Paenibacillus timonensis]